LGDEGLPHSLTWDYKIRHTSDHVAKLYGDRPKELEIPRWKKENNCS